MLYMNPWDSGLSGFLLESLVYYFSFIFITCFFVTKLMECFFMGYHRGAVYRLLDNSGRKI